MALGARGKVPNRISALAIPLRAGDWWDHKLIPALSVFYATILSYRLPIVSSVPAAIILLAALAAAAAFVSAINDLADRGDDQAAGKANWMAGRSRSLRGLFVAAPLAIGLGFLFAWRRDLPLALAYAGSWLSFSLYSLPPFRLKIRGLAGVAADAAGAHLFPSLVAILLASAAAGRGPDMRWLLAVLVWAFAYGMRGIIWHQIRDRDNDRRARVSTFATRLSRRGAARFGACVVFPVEAAALAAMLVILGSILLPAFLLAYTLLLGLRARLVGTRPRIVAADGPGAMVLQEYYELFLPVSLLAASASAHPLDGLVLLAHFAFFPRRTLTALGQAAALARILR